MSALPKIKYEEIRQLASDIREIKDFTENHGFDSSLLEVEISPKNTSAPEKESNSIQYILVFAIIGVLALSCVNVYFDISDKYSTICLLSGLALAGIASMTAQLKYKNSIATGILTSSLLAVIAIAFNIYTPREGVFSLINVLAEGCGLPESHTDPSFPKKISSVLLSRRVI